MDRQKRKLIPFFTIFPCIILNRYFIIGDHWSGSITIIFNILTFFMRDSLLCFNFSRSTSWFLDLACYFINKVSVFSLAFLLRLQIFLISRLLPIKKKLTLGRTRKSWQIHTPTVVQVRGGGGVDGTPPRSFWYVAVLWNNFALSGKPLIFLKRWGIFHGWWGCWWPVTSPTMVTILAAILDFTKN